MAVPKFDELFNPILQALQKLGGSASVQELEEQIATSLRLSDEDINEIHKGSTTKFGYRLAWARNYLKRYGCIENSARGVWALMPKGRETPAVDREDVKRVVRQLEREAAEERELQEEDAEDTDQELSWKEELLEIVKKISPAAFERLCQRLLRESGFIQVEVTGRSGDGGIDGKGVVKLGGLLSFHVIFQCKRYKDTVPAPDVRDFRGAMVGRADKGLLITTGTFTREARAEAQRDGAPPIDLVDGDELAEMLKKLSLGVLVEKETIERVKVNKEWVSSL